jgi:hypothetical protein
MLKVTKGEWHKKDLVPRATGEDYFTSRLARDFKIFPYRRNIGVVVSTVMEKDRQESLWKKWKALLRLLDPRHDAKALCPSAKGPTMTATMPPPTVRSRTVTKARRPRLCDILHIEFSQIVYIP